MPWAFLFYRSAGRVGTADGIDEILRSLERPEGWMKKPANNWLRVAIRIVLDRA